MEPKIKMENQQRNCQDYFCCVLKKQHEDGHEVSKLLAASYFISIFSGPENSALWDQKSKLDFEDSTGSPTQSFIEDRGSSFEISITESRSSFQSHYGDEEKYPVPIEQGGLREYESSPTHRRFQSTPTMQKRRTEPPLIWSVTQSAGEEDPYASKIDEDNAPVFGFTASQSSELAVFVTDLHSSGISCILHLDDEVFPCRMFLKEDTELTWVLKKRGLLAHGHKLSGRRQQEKGGRVLLTCLIHKMESVKAEKQDGGHCENAKSKHCLVIEHGDKSSADYIAKSDPGKIFLEFSRKAKMESFRHGLLLFLAEN
mmetsp:Transcript_17120/g.30119  ORF Transcript_17120/g.30119 Transcript_17120/m.30119 type:complete len:314 (+) Transcript_17120:87-1028(+)